MKFSIKVANDGKDWMSDLYYSYTTFMGVNKWGCREDAHLFESICAAGEFILDNLKSVDQDRLFIVVED